MRKTISLPKILNDAAELKSKRMGYSSFSDYLQELIRRDNPESFTTEGQAELREHVEEREREANNEAQQADRERAQEEFKKAGGKYTGAKREKKHRNNHNPTPKTK